MNLKRINYSAISSAMELQNEKSPYKFTWKTPAIKRFPFDKLLMIYTGLSSMSGRL